MTVVVRYVLLGHGGGGTLGRGKGGAWSTGRGGVYGRLG